MTEGVDVGEGGVRGDRSFTVCSPRQAGVGGLLKLL